MNDLFAGLTPEQAADAARFLAFMDEWPQDEADADPDEWARAEQIAGVLRDAGQEVSVAFLVRVIRSCELFDVISSAEQSLGDG